MRPIVCSLPLYSYYWCPMTHLSPHWAASQTLKPHSSPSCFLPSIHLLHSLHSISRVSRLCLPHHLVSLFLARVSNSFLIVGHMSIMPSLRGPPYLVYVCHHKLLGETNANVSLCFCPSPSLSVLCVPDFLTTYFRLPFLSVSNPKMHLILEFTNYMACILQQPFSQEVAR